MRINHHLATINLRQLNAFNEPVAHASGCLVRYHGHVFILTVGHAVGNQEQWAIEMEYDFDRRETKLYRLGTMNFLRLFHFKGGKIKAKDIDFSYKLMPTQDMPRHQVITASGRLVKNTQKIILDSNLDILPEVTKKYGFWGETKQRPRGRQLVITPKLETGMKYKKDRSGLYVFTTKTPYRSFTEYRGCSGAPILDSKGRLVSQVVRGDTKKESILGLSYQKLRSALDVEIMLNRA
jgi:hypothetical protein